MTQKTQELPFFKVNSSNCQSFIVSIPNDKSSGNKRDLLREQIVEDLRTALTSNIEDDHKNNILKAVVEEIVSNGSCFNEVVKRCRDLNLECEFSKAEVFDLKDEEDEPDRLPADISNVEVLTLDEMARSLDVSLTKNEEMAVDNNNNIVTESEFVQVAAVISIALAIVGLIILAIC